MAKSKTKNFLLAGTSNYCYWEGDGVECRGCCCEGARAVWNECQMQ
jgi:hypothetical protein